MDGIHPRQGAGDDGVAGFVEGHDLALLGAHDALLLEARDQPVDRRVEVARADLGLVAPGGQQGGLVDQVGEVRPREADGSSRDDLDVEVRRHLHVLHVDPQDLFASPDVWLVDQHLTIEPSGAEEGGVEHLGPVGRAHDDDALPPVEAVHLGQELVERLLALLVAPERALHARLSQRIQLVDEHDARRLGLCLLEEISDPGRADANEHLDELGPAHAEERYVRLARHRTGEQCLARARGADEQHPLGNAPAKVGVLLRGFQELDDLLQLLFGLVDTGHVAESHLHFVVGVDLGLASRERHDAALGAAQAAEEERPERHDDRERNDPAEELWQPAVEELAAVLHASRAELFGQLRVLHPRGRKRARLVGVALEGRLEGAADNLLADDDLFDRPGLDQLFELAVRNGASARHQVVHLGQADHHDHDEPVPQGRRSATERT